MDELAFAAILAAAIIILFLSAICRLCRDAGSLLDELAEGNRDGGLGAVAEEAPQQFGRPDWCDGASCGGCIFADGIRCTWEKAWREL